MCACTRVRCGLFNQQAQISEIMKKYNFNAGPSILPQEVIKQTAEAVLDFQGEGLSVLEISHRAKYFQPVVDEAEALFKELLGVPEGYRVLFLGGGASLQFCMVPFSGARKPSRKPKVSARLLRLPPAQTLSPMITIYLRTLTISISRPTTPSSARKSATPSCRRFMPRKAMYLS